MAFSSHHCESHRMQVCMQGGGGLCTDAAHDACLHTYLPQLYHCICSLYPAPYALLTATFTRFRLTSKTFCLSFPRHYKIQISLSFCLQVSAGLVCAHSAAHALFVCGGGAKQPASLISSLQSLTYAIITTIIEKN